MRRLLNQSVDLDDAGDSTAPALILAVQYNRTAVVDMLLKAGAKADVQDKDGWSPLMIASLAGQDELVVMLLAGGANPNLQTIYGWSALVSLA